MRKLSAFTQVSLDGYFSGPDDDISWAHKSNDDKEWNEFVSNNASGGGALMFGRITYDLMASYWPTPMAAKNMPVVAEHMNKLPKIVFSKKMKQAAWSNTTLVKGDIIAAVRKMKKESGPDIVILGSGTIVAQLTQAGLIDAYQIVVNPVVLGEGRTAFEGIKDIAELKLTKTRTFGNGNVLLCYESAA